MTPTELDALVERLREAKYFRDSEDLDLDHRFQWAVRANEIQDKIITDLREELARVKGGRDKDAP